MKRYLIISVCLLAATAIAGAATIVSQLQLGLNTASVTWNWNHSGTGGPLGVSTTPGGTLITSNLTAGVYYLYATSSTTPITNFSIQLWCTDTGSSTDYHFNNTFSPITGTPGAFQLWPEPPFTENFDSFPSLPTIWLGWAQGTADQVGPAAAAPDGSNDFYLVLGIGQQPTAPDSGVPEPASALLIAAGIGALVALRRRC